MPGTQKRIVSHNQAPGANERNLTAEPEKAKHSNAEQMARGNAKEQYACMLWANKEL